MPDAKRIAEAAEASAVMGPATGPQTAAGIQEASADSVKPTPWKERDGKPGTAVTISCASISLTCERQAKLQADMLKQLGWKATKVSAGNDFSPVSYQRAMSQVVAQKPDVIIANGITAQYVASQLKAAKKEGIFTIVTNPNEASGPGWDQYNPAGIPLSAAVSGAKVATATNGTGQIQWFDVPAFPFLGVKDAVDFTKEICPSCSIDTQDTTAEKVTDPVAIGGLVNQTIQGNPKLEAIVLAGDSNLGAARLAAERSTNPDVPIYSNSFNSGTATAMRDGATPAMIGTANAWSAVVSVDLALRHRIGEPPVPDNEIPIGSQIMLPDEVPGGKLDEAVIDKWSVKQFDYLAPYSEAWGVDLNAVL